MKPMTDMQTSSQDWELEPEVIINYDVLYGGEWESEFNKITFDNDEDESSLPSSRCLALETDQRTAEVCTTPGTTSKGCPETSPQTDGLHYGKDTDQDISNYMETRSEHRYPNPTSSLSTEIGVR